MDAQQIEALKLVLKHYGSDPRVHCLIPLTYDVPVVEDPFLPETKQIIPPVEGWEADTLYLVKVSYNAQNPVHEAFLHIGFLNKDNQPGSYSEIWANDYEEAEAYSRAIYLRVVKKLHQGTD